jgi:hypothetical protein
MARLIAAFYMLVFTHAAMAQSAFDSDDIGAVQAGLYMEGYEVGGMDGRFGGKTAAAIRQYQSDWQLPQTGEISRDLIDRLMRRHPATKPQWLKTENGVCTAWSEYPHAQETTPWSGGCAGGKASGSGTLAWRYVRAGSIVNGDRYEGEVRDGKFNGHGVYTASYGDSWEGEWRDGEMRDGRGVHTSTLSRYEGEFRGGEPNGRGVQTYDDGERYEGEFRDGRRNGHGVFTWLNGNRYEGEYRDGMPNGRGTYTSAGVDHSGNWRNGCLSENGQNWAVHATKSECGF